MPKKTFRKSKITKVRVVKQRKHRNKLTVLPRTYKFKRTADLGGSNPTSYLSWTTGQASGGSTQGNAVVVTPDGCYFDSGIGSNTQITYYGYTMTCALAMLPEYSNITAMFETYRINKVRLTFEFFSSATQPDDQVYGQQPKTIMHYNVIDLDDNTTSYPDASFLTKLRNRPSFKEQNMTSRSKWTRSVVPKTSVGMTNLAGTVVGRSVQVKQPWIETNDFDVPHYGYKGMFQMFAPAFNQHYFAWFRPFLEVWFECKNPK